MFACIINHGNILCVLLKIPGEYNMKIAKSKKKLIRNILIICVAYFVVSSFVTTFARIQEYNSQISSLNEQIADEKATNKELNKIKSKIHSDENYKDIARNTLGLVNPGDKVYVNSNDSK